MYKQYGSLRCDMACAKTNETLMIRDRTGHLFKQTEALKYLGSVMNAKGGCEQDQGRLAKVERPI